MKGVFQLARRLRIHQIFVIATALSFCSCASQSVPTNPVASPQQSYDSAAPASSNLSQPLFYDFPDIPVPHELTVQRGDSYVYQQGKERVGILTCKGRVEVTSLIRFFQVGLPKEGWISKGGFRYHRSMLLFEKPNKTCVIDIYEELFSTYVEIYVIPKTEGRREKS